MCKSTDPDQYALQGGQEECRGRGFLGPVTEISSEFALGCP